MSEVTYLDPADVTEARADREAPRYGRDAQGYGRKIPTRYRVRTKATGKRWLRLYVCSVSNASTEFLSTKENPFWCASRASDKIRALCDANGSRA